MADIADLRDNIDAVTREMVKLLKIRTDTARQIGEIKQKTGRAITDEARERNLRDKVSLLCKHIGMDTESAVHLLNLLINESTKVQSTTTTPSAPSPPTHLSLFHRAKFLEEQGRKIIHMEVGEPDFEPPKAVGAALGRAFEEGYLRYGHPAGIPIFRKAIAEYASDMFGAELAPGNIMVTPGARFAVFAAVTTLLDPGDEMIIIEPAWPAYRQCATHAGVKVRTVHTSLDGGWEPSLETLQDLVNDYTKMIVLNYPNNPTGKVLPPALLDSIMDLARSHGLYVLSDEIYSQYTYDDSGWKSVLTYGYDRSIVTQSFSKSHAMTGFRIGYAVASLDTIEQMAGLGALCLTSVAAPIQYAAMAALREKTESNTDTIRHRLDALVHKMDSVPDLEFARPNGAMYVFARVHRDGFDGAQFAHHALEEHGLAVAPGIGFGDNYANHIRISACQDEKTLIKGLNILYDIIMTRNDYP